MKSKIVQVSYARLMVTAPYENERVEAVATVSEGENPKLVLALLRKWVNEELANKTRRRGK